MSRTGSRPPSAARRSSRLRRFGRGPGARLVGKIEARNPGGSVKDRIGRGDDRGRRAARACSGPGGTLVEPTSGNTGIALAFVAAAKGYRLILTMPERCAQERVALLRCLGAEVVLTPGTLMGEAVERAARVVARTPGAVMLQQFENPANPEAHRRPRPWRSGRTPTARSTVVVAGVGHGRHHHRRRRGAEGRRSPACAWSPSSPPSAAVLSGGAPAAHHPGHRRRLRPDDPEPRAHRRGRGRHRGRRVRSRAPAGARGGHPRRHLGGRALAARAGVARAPRMRAR